MNDRAAESRTAGQALGATLLPLGSTENGFKTGAFAQLSSHSTLFFVTKNGTEALLYAVCFSIGCDMPLTFFHKMLRTFTTEAPFFSVARFVRETVCRNNLCSKSDV